MIPDDATGTITHQCEVFYPGKATGEGVLMLNKPDGPGRWHWQIVWYEWAPGDLTATSVDAWSTDARDKALMTFAARMGALIRKVEAGEVICSVNF